MWVYSRGRMLSGKRGALLLLFRCRSSLTRTPATVGRCRRAHTVRAMEDAGVAGLFMEDQEDPKRCAHLAGTTVISTDAMLGKLKAAPRRATGLRFLDHRADGCRRERGSGRGRSTGTRLS